MKFSSLAICLLVIVFLIALFGGRLVDRLSVSSASNSQVRPHWVDINVAKESELSLLPRIGKARALEIVRHRTQHGPFKKLEDLLEVHGIGPETLAQMRAFLVLTPETKPASVYNPANVQNKNGSPATQK